MKNKGFTLVELLGVIIILSLLMLIVLPKITNSTRNSSIKVDKVTEDLIFKATNLYLNDKEDEYTKGDGVVYCISLNDLVDNDYLKSPIKTSNNDDITNVKVVEANYQNGYSYKLKDNGTCIQRIPSNKPDLFNGDLTPIKYNGTNWVVVDGSKTNWYNYENQEWANAVILNNEVTKNIGDTVDVNSEVKAMFVWIPRYEYKIEGTYGKGGTSANSPGEIEVNFVLNTKSRSSEGYRIHPAFKFGSKELTGIWASKFNTTGTSDNPTVLPDQIMLGNQNISTQFATSQKFNSYITNADSHMMKNSEWGAVIYLSQSKYGKYGNNMYTGANKEIYINIGVNFTAKTVTSGKSGGTILKDDMTSQDLNSLVSSACSYNDITNRGNGIGSCGGGASTTGNITGVYDISQYGAIWLMAVLADEDGNPISGYTSESNSGYRGKLSDGTLYEGVLLPDSKYYDLYTSTDSSSTDINISKTACDGGVCYGHGLSETIDWYGDYMIFASSNRPWLIRGYGGSKPSHTGVFAVGSNHGNANPSISFRVVLSAE